MTDSAVIVAKGEPTWWVELAGWLDSPVLDNGEMTWRTVLTLVAILCFLIVLTRTAARS